MNIFPRLASAFSVSACVFSLALGLSPQETSHDAPARSPWPQWRGPAGTGVAVGAEPPLQWSETEHVRWRTPLPGLGHSTPVIAEDLVLLTFAHPIGEVVAPRPEDSPGAHDNLAVTQRHNFGALAVRIADGTVAWQADLAQGFPHEGGHVTGSYASASPVTDGERFFASFGSVGVFALDLEGNELWKRNLGTMRTKHGHGEGSGPALDEGRLFLNWDHEGQSFLTALDAISGEELWRVPRDEVTSWSTPLVIHVDGRTQLVVNGTNYVRGYDPATGAEIWRCGGLSHNVVASPVFADGMLFAASSYEKQALLALRLEGARGDLADTEHLAWYQRRNTPYVPSPLLFGDTLYVLTHYQGILSSIDAKTGRQDRRPLRIDGLNDLYASPLGAGERIYLVDRSGETVVLSRAPALKILARNRLDDHFSASPIAVGRDLFLRGERFLYCLAESDQEP